MYSFGNSDFYNVLLHILHQKDLQMLDMLIEHARSTGHVSGTNANLETQWTTKTHLCAYFKLLPLPASNLYICTHIYASTSLSCAGIQQQKSVSFHCWAAINLVGEMSNEEQDTPSPTLSTIFLPHCVKSSTSLLALDEQWGAGHPGPCPTHPFPSSLCEEFCMSDNMCFSCPPAVVLAYWDPGGLAHFNYE